MARRAGFRHAHVTKRRISNTLKGRRRLGGFHPVHASAPRREPNFGTMHATKARIGAASRNVGRGPLPLGPKLAQPKSVRATPKGRKPKHNFVKTSGKVNGHLTGFQGARRKAINIGARRLAGKGIKFKMGAPSREGKAAKTSLHKPTFVKSKGGLRTSTIPR